MEEALQAAGHGGARQGEGLYIKPTCQNEIDFYQWIMQQGGELSSFVPLFMGTLQEQNESDAQGNVKPLLVMEDLCQGFEQPSVMDVKLGSQLWDELTPTGKKERLMAVSRSTTSGSLGFRIAGMTVVQPMGTRQAFDKQFGREATPQTIEIFLSQFWPLLCSDNYVFSTLASIIAQLEQLHAVLSSQHLEMHSASVLLIYEGNLEALHRKATSVGDENHADDSDDDLIAEKNKLVDVRLIDFAHTTQSDRPDYDVLGGLSALIASLKKLTQGSARNTSLVTSKVVNQQSSSKEAI